MSLNAACPPMCRDHDGFPLPSKTSSGEEGPNVILPHELAGFRPDHRLPPSLTASPAPVLRQANSKVEDGTQLDYRRDMRGGSPAGADELGQWLDVTSDLPETARKAVLDLPTTVFLRSGDALHLACAEEHGFQEVYTNDSQMLKAARHFHLTGVDVLGESR